MLPVGSAEEVLPGAEVVAHAAAMDGNAYLGQRVRRGQTGNAMERPYRLGGGTAEILALGISPVVLRGGTDVQLPRGDERQQHVLVEGHFEFAVGPAAIVFAEPVGKSAGNLGDGLSRTATGKRITGISRATACRHEKPLVLRKGPEGRFPSSGMSNHADMARIGLRRLEEYGIHVRFPKYALSGVSYPRTRQESRRPAGCTDMVFCATRGVDSYGCRG